MRSAVGRNSSSSAPPPDAITARTAPKTSSAVVCFIAQKSSISCSTIATYCSKIGVHSSRCSSATSASSNARAFAVWKSKMALRKRFDMTWCTNPCTTSGSAFGAASPSSASLPPPSNFESCSQACVGRRASPRER